MLLHERVSSFRFRSSFPGMFQHMQDPVRKGLGIPRSKKSDGPVINDLTKRR